MIKRKLKLLSVYSIYANEIKIALKQNVTIQDDLSIIRRFTQLYRIELTCIPLLNIKSNSGRYVNIGDEIINSE